MHSVLKSVGLQPYAKVGQMISLESGKGSTDNLEIYDPSPVDVFFLPLASVISKIYILHTEHCWECKELDSVSCFIKGIISSPLQTGESEDGKGFSWKNNCKWGTSVNKYFQSLPHVHLLSIFKVCNL